MSYEDQDYHRRRAEIEMECAVTAESPETAIAHLELAQLHRARRQIIAQARTDGARQRLGASIFRADKEA